MAAKTVSVVVAEAVTVYRDGVGYPAGQEIKVPPAEAKQLLADGLVVKP